MQHSEAVAEQPTGMTGGQLEARAGVCTVLCPCNNLLWCSRLANQL